MTRARTFAALLGVLIVGWSTRLLAVDGVIEINQAAVFAGGITPGDAPGFPATLSQSGSFRLSGNLDVTKMQNGNPQPTPEDVTAVEITTNDVTLDLNGFAIIGPTTCDGASPPACNPAGTGIGIKANNRQGVTVVNGIVRGMAGGGVVLRECKEAHVEHMRLHDLAGDFAMICGFLCQAIGNQIANSSTQGINAGSNGSSNGSIVQGNTITTLTFDGIITTGVVKDNTVRGAHTGINTGVGSTVVHNFLTENRHQGIQSVASTIINNQVSENMGEGILVPSGATEGALILGNNITHNGLLGIKAEAEPGQIGFGQNVLNDNNGGNANPQTSAGMREIPSGSNVCGGDLICP